ncbi:cytochrome ubiquinol oxidase subunit I [Hydrogenovibrio sp. JE_KL2]|uniref:cytochrome ubiquinol oxidase subunit I n=1 Tax=Hydrogenovibrio sp. JE_KL2 TaxID=2651188 RepID=UPI00128D5FC1|nr:cytochrome ubiquinol oxidase subunit I [Hydrogenovibrio sp. JE_KL2]MPQ77131.1 cytochrome ubiquinol oxidase subunit I [Hydrogenovibrio sp. JE_KL2]
MESLLDPTLLARAQFAFTIAFHIIFPALSIGLGSYLLVLEGLALWKKNPVYFALFDYWKRIFAVTFVLGTVTGLTMSFQFGTNWSVFAEKTGPILGPLIAYETQTAFFLEAIFLSVLLFGRKRVSPKIHLFATAMVALGSLISAFWILTTNSWMQTPAGFSINAAGQFVPADWWQIIFNPSMPYRFVHMVLAAFLSTAFFVGGVGAWQLLKDANHPVARKMFSMSMWMILFTAPLQIIAGDQQGLNTEQYQPAKIAAIEGHYQAQKGAPLILFGLPDDKDQTVKYAVEIPKLGSLILTHSLNGKVDGLDEFPADKRPPTPIVFWSFRIMVGLGFLMLGLALWGLWARKKHHFYDNKRLLKLSVLMAPTGLMAILAGWVTTEVGRQPYLVYGHLLTSESVSKTPVAFLTTSFTAYVISYIAILLFAVYFMFKLLKKLPDTQEVSHDYY